MRWDKKFKLIDKALGFKLNQWQKDYISMKIDFIPETGRQTGKTIAFILRHLLNYEDQLYIHAFYVRGYEQVPDYSIFPCDCPNVATVKQYYDNFYIKEVIKIQTKLHKVGLKTSLDDYFMSLRTFMNISEDI